MNNVFKKKVRIATVVLLGSILVVGVGFGSMLASQAASSQVSTNGVVTVAQYNSSNKIEKVGAGYNALTGDYTKMQGIINNNFIFSKKSSSSNSDKVIEDTYVNVDTGYSNGRSYILSGRNSEEFYNSLKGEVNLKNTTNLSGDLSPLSLKLVLEVNNKFEAQVKEGKVSEYIMSVKEPVVASVSWNLKESQYYDYLDEDFKKDLVNMEPEKLFNKYGTHFFTSYLLGGRLEINAMITSDTYEQLNNLSTTFKSTLNTDGKIENNKVNSNTDMTNKVEISDKDTLASSDIKTEARYYGGKEANFDAYADLLAAQVLGTKDKNSNNNVSCDKIYTDWITSVEEDPTLIDVYDSNSLYPIWDLLVLFPEDYELASKQELTERSNILEDKYKELQTQYDKEIKDQVESIQGKEKSTIIPTKLTGYKDNSSYDDMSKIDEGLAKIHSGYKLGEVSISNAYRNEDDKVVLTNNQFQIIYSMLQDKTNLPLGEEENAIKHNVIKDLDMNFNINGYGDIFKYMYLYKGAAYIQIKYKNGVTAKPIKLNNIFEEGNKNDENSNKMSINKGDSVVLYQSNPSEVFENGGVESINVLILYKTRDSFYENGISYSKKIKWMDEGSIIFK